jgi:succinoglycan biosynthesis transport protein ExoP
MNDQMTDSEVVKVSPASHAGVPDLMGILLRRKAYLVLGTAIGLILGLVYYVLAPKRYESTAQILVQKKQTDTPFKDAMKPEAGSNSSSGSNQDFLETHRAVLRSPLLVGRAIEKANLQELDSFRGEDQLVVSIIKSLKVEREVDKKMAAHLNFNSQVLNISFTGSVPEESSTVVSGILDAYQMFLDESSREGTKQSMKLFNRAFELIQKELTDKEKEWAKFRQEATVLWKGPNGATLYQERLGAIDSRRASLMREEAELRATLEAVNLAMKKGDPAAAMQIISGLPATREMTTPLIPTPIGATMMLGGSPQNLPTSTSTAAVDTMGKTLESELLRLHLKEAELLESYGPNHPDVVAVRDRLRTIQDLIVPGGADPANPGKLSEKGARAARKMVETKVGQMKQQLQEIQRSQQAQQELFGEELKAAKKVFPYETQDETFKRQIDRSYFLYDNLLRQLADLDILSNEGGYNAQILAQPQPGEKVSPKPYLVFPIALFLGLLCGFGVGYLAEMADKSFRGPEEIRARLGLPLIGHIPVVKQDEKLLQKIEAEGGQMSPVVCAHYRPKSRDAEAYRGVRTALYFSTRGGNYKTIQVTSPDMGDGKSTLAANLAVSIAQSGKKVILVDADLRRPQQHSIFGLPNQVGFASILAGTAEIAEATHATQAPGLSIITSGSLPPNPAELLTSHRFKEMLNVLSEQYDLVLVDSPPLLAVSDPSVIAPRVDGVILTLRIRDKGRPHAEQAREILSSLGAHVLGVVVNAVKGASGKRYGYGGYGYGYGGYGYGYGYDYGYGYGYGYGSDENSKYYTEEAEEKSNGKV